jgi:hypothetical protein
VRGLGGLIRVKWGCFKGQMCEGVAVCCAAILRQFFVIVIFCVSQVYGESLWRSKLQQQQQQQQNQQQQLQEQQEQQEPHHHTRRDHLSSPSPSALSTPPPPPPPPLTLLEVSPQSLKIMAGISKVKTASFLPHTPTPPPP